MSTTESFQASQLCSGKGHRSVLFPIRFFVCKQSVTGGSKLKWIDGIACGAVE